MRRARIDPEVEWFRSVWGLGFRLCRLWQKSGSPAVASSLWRLFFVSLLVIGVAALPGGPLVTPPFVPPLPAPAPLLSPVSATPAVATPVSAKTVSATVASAFYRGLGNSRQQRSEHVSRSWQLIGGVGVNVIYVNTRPENVRVVVGFGAGADPVRGYFPRDNFYRIVKWYRPRAAINGTYFHLTNGQPTGSIVRNGSFLYDGRWGTTICLDRDGHVSFRYQSGTLGHHRGWAGVENAITTGPTLVRDGKLYLHARAEGFRDTNMLGIARRSAIGLTWDDRLILVTVPTPISLNKLSNIMLRFSCKAAANLDGGSSSALYCNGEFITKPQRALSHVLLVYD